MSSPMYLANPSIFAALQADPLVAPSVKLSPEAMQEAFNAIASAAMVPEFEQVETIHGSMITITSEVGFESLFNMGMSVECVFSSGLSYVFRAKPIANSIFFSAKELWAIHPIVGARTRIALGDWAKEYGPEYEPPVPYTIHDEMEDEFFEARET